MSGRLFPSYDDIVGLDIPFAKHSPRLPPARLRRLHEQLAGIALDKPVMPSGLAVYAMLPRPERVTHLRTRMAAEISRAVSANGCVTRDDLVAAGFTGEEIAEHFTAARRAARVDRMAV